MDTLDLPCMPVVNGIPSSHSESTFANFDFASCPSLKEWTLALIERTKYFWLYLHGPTGRGKTHYSVALHRAIVAHVGWESTGSSTFVQWRDLISDIRNSFGDHTTDDLLAVYLECDILIIDDVTGSLADFQIRTLEQIVQQRHAMKKTLVVTSNEPYETFLGRFEAHEVSRIKEVCMPAMFGGLDRRDR
jgi:DNA replication protein DnaC